MTEIPDHSRWTPWSPWDIQEKLSGLKAHWHVAGGWAIDLWLSKNTRQHSDLEIAILRDDLPLFLPFFSEFQLMLAGHGQVFPLLKDCDPPEQYHQIWILDKKDKVWRMDILLEPGTHDRWVYRRDPKVGRLRRHMIGQTQDGISFLRPEGVLLYKAKYCRPKDEEDFAHCLPELSDQSRCWLREILQKTHPGHDWIDQL